MEMLTIAVIGLLVNIVVALILGSDHQHDRDHDQGSQKTQRNLNVQSALLHVVGDVISWLA